jgi:mannose-6-phosphate isomerase-like protein (cupin superfamily)
MKKEKFQEWNGMIKMKIKEEVVQKTWGNEIWFANTENYCGKLITVESGKWSSEGKFHYHEIKDETFFVIEGLLWLDIAKENGKYDRFVLLTGDAYRISPGIKHRFSSASQIPCKFVEASTHHEDSDSYRCYYNEKEKEWIYD